MRHEKALKMLARRYELSDGDESALGDHLKLCGGCRELAAEYTEHDAMLTTIPRTEAPAGLRQAVLTQAGRSVPRRRSPIPVAPLGLAAAVILLGFSLAASQGWLLFSTTKRSLSEGQAIRAALVHTVVGSHRKLPSTVRVTARLGTFSGVDHAWLVTVSGPGVSVISPAVLVGEIHLPSPPIIHRETAVVNGTTGAFVETYTAAG